MTKPEAQNFIEKVLKGLWAEWAPTDIQLSNWMLKLQACEYAKAKNAVENVWRNETIQHRRPPQGKIFEALKRCVSKEKTINAELPQTTIYIRCIEPPEHAPNRTAHLIPVYPDDLKRIGDEDYVRRCAFSMAARFQQLYGGTWGVLIGKKHEPSELIGEEAREKAFNDILSGPDTKTKRWLRQYLASKEKAKKEKKGPVQISKAVAEYAVL